MTGSDRAVPLAEEDEHRVAEGLGSTSGGTSGAASNLPSYAANAARQRQQLQEHDGRQASTAPIRPSPRPGEGHGAASTASSDLDVGQMTARQPRVAAGLQIAQRKDTPTSPRASPRADQCAAKARSCRRGHPQGPGYRLGAPLFLFLRLRLRKRAKIDVVAAPWRPRSLGGHADAGPPAVRGDRTCRIANARPAAPAARHDHPGSPESAAAAHLALWITEDSKERRRLHRLSGPDRPP